MRSKLRRLHRRFKGKLHSIQKGANKLKLPPFGNNNKSTKGYKWSINQRTTTRKKRLGILPSRRPIIHSIQYRLVSPSTIAKMVGNHKAIRLPPLKTLRVHNPKRQVENPCIAIMSSVLACWASAGYNATGCAAVETQLRKCMDGPAAPPAPTNTINYHLARMQKYMTGPRKQK
jgi:hypothetical protein